ncbi:uncharacterized protein RCC_06675 [Ramularia collo-cygni]|uniref:Uncharacterized protein n=1 Tax=Ramularia collo-cygni TaxID=112498 RepID=A0A2D3V7T2_9PEZI|nr:uncharacterized protein RCC_06675 [Ramularia collo-cygni]CZT20817.1 uncharacterized protein RCC_06675 [Ramularia collo-cygni]
MSTPELTRLTEVTTTQIFLHARETDISNISTTHEGPAISATHEGPAISKEPSGTADGSLEISSPSASVVSDGGVALTPAQAIINFQTEILPFQNRLTIAEFRNDRSQRTCQSLPQDATMGH